MDEAMTTAAEPDDLRLRAYLLGALSEHDAEAVEGKLLEDEELFAAAKCVEDDLFDDYASGRLHGDDRAAFIKRFGHRHDRLAFAAAMHDRKVVRFPTMPVTLAAAAVLVLMIGGIWSMRRSSERTPLIAEKRPAPVATTARAVDVVLTLGTSRGDAETPVIEVPTGTTTVNIRIRIHPEDAFGVYGVRIRSLSGAEVFRDDDVHATVANGDRSLTVAVPASSLPAGSTEIEVTGNDEPLGFETIEVTRRK